MNKKKLNRILILSAAGVLAVLALVSMAGALNRRSANMAATDGGPVVIEATDVPEAAIVSVALPEDTPEPEPSLPAGAATLLVDGVPVLTLSSEAEIQALLRDYLTAAAVAPEDERFVAASFSAELVIVPASEDRRLGTYADALALLKNAPQTVPVRLTTDKTVVTETDFETNASVDAALPKGTRLITQLGAKSYAATVTRCSYVAGKQEEYCTEVGETKQDGRSAIVRTGSWESGGDEPGRSEGKKGRDAEELSLVWPMRGTLKAYFGMYGGKMNNGVDIQANAGTTVSAPGEGLVIYSGVRGAYGYVVDIDHGNGFMSRLTHIDPDSVQIEFNQRVFSGDQIGTLAAAEAGKKPSLHYELWIDSVPYNPVLYIG